MTPMICIFLAADFAPLIIFPLFIALFVGLAALGIYQSKKARENWARFAATYGLQMTGGESWTSRPHISGWFDGIYVHIGTITRGSGKNRSTYTQFQAMLNCPMPLGLQIHQESVFSKVGKFFGGQDIHVGDSAIDDAFILKGRDENAVRHFVSQPAIRQALFRIVQTRPDFVLYAGNIMMEQRGMVSDPARMYSAISEAVLLARAITDTMQQLAPQAAPMKVPAPPPARPIELPVAAPALRPQPKPAAKAAKVAAPLTNLPGPKPDNTPRGDGGIMAVLDRLSDASLLGSERDEALAKLKDQSVTLPVIVERVELTSSFDVPDELKDGRTVVGTLSGLRTKLAVRFDAAKSRELSGLRRGDNFTVQGRIASWDPLYDRVNVNA